MQQHYLILFAGLLTQETAFAEYSIYQARAAGIDWMQIHFMWTAITLFHITIPYFVIITFREKKFFSKLLKNRFVIKISKAVEKRGLFKTFFILGIFNFVYLNSFIAALLSKDLKKIFLPIFLGDLVWYLIVVGLYTGVIEVFESNGLTIIILISVIFTIFGKKFLHGIMNKGGEEKGDFKFEKTQD